MARREDAMTKGFGRALALASAACALLASLAVAQKKPAPGTGGRSQPSSDQGPAAKAGEGERAKPIRAVLRRVSADRHVFEMYEKYLDDREWKVVEITYNRVK